MMSRTTRRIWDWCDPGALRRDANESPHLIFIFYNQDGWACVVHPAAFSFSRLLKNGGF